MRPVLNRMLGGCAPRDLESARARLRQLEDYLGQFSGQDLEYYRARLAPELSALKARIARGEEE